MNRLEFGDEIRAIRKKKQLTLAAAAEKIGTVSPTYLSLLESGGIKRPRWDVINALCKAYKLSDRRVLAVYFPDKEVAANAQ